MQELSNELARLDLQLQQLNNDLVEIPSSLPPRDEPKKKKMVSELEQAFQKLKKSTTSKPTSQDIPAIEKKLMLS